jgi:F-type H+-transporting ATPase subunit b
MNILTQFAATSTASSSVFTALGIDWKMLIFQIVAFVVLVWLLGRYVYPILIKTVDARQAEIEAGSKAAEEAEKKAVEAKESIERLLKQARAEAGDIVSTAKEEATAAIEAAEAKSKVRAEHIITEAHIQLEKDVHAAKVALHNETLSLVALATEKVIGKAVTADVDNKVIAASVKEAQ